MTKVQFSLTMHFSYQLSAVLLQVLFILRARLIQQPLFGTLLMKVAEFATPKNATLEKGNWEYIRQVLCPSLFVWKQNINLEKHPSSPLYQKGQALIPGDDFGPLSMEKTLT